MKLPSAAEAERYVEALLASLPPRAERSFRWLLDRRRRWLRIPAGILLMLGGVLSFLPVLGLWMLPLGALLLAEDLPWLRRVTVGALQWLEPRWRSLRTRAGF